MAGAFFVKNNMPLFILDDSMDFPPAELARPDGLLAIGGDLSVPRLISAYKSGIFPWYNEGEPILWWSPDPRLVLYPEELHISKRLQRTIKQKRFKITFNAAFEQVIRMCADVRREKGQDTWIDEDMIRAYIRLYEQGLCLSAEAWYQDKLAGGLYGVWLEKVFFGESMFYLIKDASKVAFAATVQKLQSEGTKLVDCQVPTRHLERFGARLISRQKFLEQLKKWA